MAQYKAPIAADIEALITPLRLAAGTGKPQFEKTSEYEARLQAALKKIGRRHSLQTLVEPEYDADSEVVSFKLRDNVLDHFFESVNKPVNFEDLPALILKTKLLSKANYGGQNGFGARTVVVERAYHLFGVVIGPDSKMRPKDLINPEFSMGRKQAIGDLPLLDLYIEGVITSTDVYRDSRLRKATIERPSETLTTLYCVPFSIEKIFVVNRRTGKVIYLDDETNP